MRCLYHSGVVKTTRVFIVIRPVQKLLKKGVDSLNKKCVACTDEEYKRCVDLLRYGFVLDGVSIIPNPRIATIVILEATLGLRIGDILKLKLSSFVKDGGRWRLDIVEQKTKKKRTFLVPLEVYSFILEYAVSNNIGVDAKLFDISARQVERQLNKVFTKMEVPLRNYGTHTFRKYFCGKIYTQNDYDLILTQTIMQHSSPETTRRYLNVSTKRIEDALEKTANNLL